MLANAALACHKLEVLDRQYCQSCFPAHEQAQHAAAILEEEYPDEGERRRASAAAREAATPVPEKVWALRNVGTTLSLGGSASQLDRARQMLERAVVLKQQWLGDPRHPGRSCLQAAGQCATNRAMHA